MCRKYVTTGPNGEPILYVRLLKALYRLLRLALLFYKKLRGNLENMGYVRFSGRQHATLQSFVNR